MSTHAVPAHASSVPIGEAWWFRFLVRTALALLAARMLLLAVDRWFASGAIATATFRFDNSRWLIFVGELVAAGLLFGLACWLPFTKVRFLPSRLLLAGLAFLPLAQWWWLFMQHHGRSGGWLGHWYWFDSTPIQFVSAVLVGVAIASGFRAQRSMPAPGVSLSLH